MSLPSRERGLKLQVWDRPGLAEVWVEIYLTYGT